jgi:hypothetical protein
MGRHLDEYFRSIDARPKGQDGPKHDLNDLDHFNTYIERRAVLTAVIGFVTVAVAAAFVSYLVWGVPQRIFVALFGIAYWPAAWQFYLRHHYKPEYRPGAEPSTADGSGDG